MSSEYMSMDVVEWEWRNRRSNQHLCDCNYLTNEPLPEPPPEWIGLQEYLLSIADEWEWDGIIPF